MEIFPYSASGFVSIDSCSLKRKYYTWWELALLKRGDLEETKLLKQIEKKLYKTTKLKEKGEEKKGFFGSKKKK